MLESSKAQEVSREDFLAMLETRRQSRKDFLAILNRGHAKVERHTSLRRNGQSGVLLAAPSCRCQLPVLSALTPLLVAPLLASLCSTEIYPGLGPAKLHFLARLAAGTCPGVAPRGSQS